MGGRAGICRVEILLPRDVEVMDEDRLQGSRANWRPSAQCPGSDDEAELLRLQASLPCHSSIASSFARVVLKLLFSVLMRSVLR